MSLEHFEKGASKTGFPLEHEISEVLRAKSWLVISNKYYLDDSEDSVREIDLIAYKARKVGRFSVYTVLIISCKKSEANAWVLFARKSNELDPNRIMYPVHVWTNDKIIAHQLKADDFANSFYKAKPRLGVLADLEFDIFAFQEMKKESGTPQNDRAIFQSLTSLMKAQAYEKNALPVRKTDSCVYHFSLLTVVDAQLVRIDFDKGRPKAVETRDVTMLANYIVNKAEESSRIRIVHSNEFSRVIEDYADLHERNCTFFDTMFKKYYIDVMRDPARVAVQLDEFRNAVRFKLELLAYKRFKSFPNFRGLDLGWFESAKKVQISLTLSGSQLEQFNADEEARTICRNGLAEVYHYLGDFELDQEIPF